MHKLCRFTLSIFASYAKNSCTVNTISLEESIQLFCRVYPEVVCSVSKFSLTNSSIVRSSCLRRFLRGPHASFNQAGTGAFRSRCTGLYIYTRVPDPTPAIAAMTFDAASPVGEHRGTAWLTTLCRLLVGGVNLKTVLGAEDIALGLRQVFLYHHRHQLFQ